MDANEIVDEDLRKVFDVIFDNIEHRYEDCMPQSVYYDKPSPEDCPLCGALQAIENLKNKL